MTIPSSRRLRRPTHGAQLVSHTYNKKRGASDKSLGCRGPPRSVRASPSHRARDFCGKREREGGRERELPNLKREVSVAPRSARRLLRSDLKIAGDRLYLGKRELEECRRVRPITRSRVSTRTTGLSGPANPSRIHLDQRNYSGFRELMELAKEAGG